MDKFDLVENSPVLIYGAGAFGRKIYNRIREMYDVKGFIDKKKISLGDQEINLPVYQLNELTDLQKCIVIVCVHNATWHYEIAEKLYANGFNKIIFLAVKNVYNINMTKDMNKAFSFLMEENFENLRFIPCYSVLKRPYDDSIIRKSGNHIVTFCNRELIFSFNGIEEHNKDKIRKEHLLYIDCPMPGFESYLSLMNYFINAENNPDIYISLMKDLNNSFVMDNAEFLENQWKIYQLLENEYAKGIDSFQYAPLDVVWNEKGYFNILDGHHRAAFYYVKGLRNFPVRMKVEDYECWINTEKVEAVKNELKEIIPKVSIMHPYFTQVDYVIKEYEESSVEIVLKYIYKNNIEYDGILDISDFGGEFARSFYRTGRAKKIISVAEKDEYKLQKAINELHYIPIDVFCIENDKLENLEGNFQCGVICGKYNLKELEQARILFNSIISDEIIWQSKEHIEDEKNFILTNTKFKKYTMLGRKCVNGRIREIGVFKRNEQ